MKPLSMKWKVQGSDEHVESKVKPIVKKGMRARQHPSI